MRNTLSFLTLFIISIAFTNAGAASISTKTILSTQKKAAAAQRSKAFTGLYIPVKDKKLKQARAQADKTWKLLEEKLKELHINHHGEKALVLNCGTGFFSHKLAKQGARPTSISKYPDVTKLSKQTSDYNGINNSGSRPAEKGTCFKTTPTINSFLKKTKAGQFDSAYIPQNIADPLISNKGLPAAVNYLSNKVSYVIILSTVALPTKDLRANWVCQKTHTPTARNQGQQPHITFLIPKTVTVGRKKFTTEQFVQFDGGATCYLCKGGSFVKFYSNNSKAAEQTKKELDFYKAANKNKRIRNVPKCKAVQTSKKSKQGPKHKHSKPSKKKKSNAVALSTVPGKSLNYIRKLSNAEKTYIFYKVCQIAAQFDRARICHTGIMNRNVMYDKKSKKVSLVDFERTSINHAQTASSLLRLCWELGHHGEDLSTLSKGFKRNQTNAKLYGIFAPIARKIMGSNAVTPRDVCADAKKLMKKRKK